MAVGAVIEDGKVVETAAESSVKSASSAKNGMDKDAFLQLLVAQMKYQDPLEPTSNTEYISQYATFSQVEQMQNMSASMELSRASSMVGQLVEVTTTDADDNTKSLQGIVEYVTYENNKAYVSIDGTLYAADKVTSVIDPTYQTAYDLALAFAVSMNKLPSLSDLKASDEETITSLKDGYNKMTAYQQSFISKDYVEKLQSYVERMAELTGSSDSDEDADAEKDAEGDTEGSSEGETV